MQSEVNEPMPLQEDSGLVGKALEKGEKGIHDMRLWKLIMERCGSLIFKNADGATKEID